MLILVNYFLIHLLTGGNIYVLFQADDYANKSNEFFRLPLEEKEVYSRPISLTDNGGWVAIGREKFVLFLAYCVII